MACPRWARPTCSVSALAPSRARGGARAAAASHDFTPRPLPPALAGRDPSADPGARAAPDTDTGSGAARSVSARSVSPEAARGARGSAARSGSAAGSACPTGGSAPPAGAARPLAASPPRAGPPEQGCAGGAAAQAAAAPAAASPVRRTTDGSQSAGGLRSSQAEAGPRPELQEWLEPAREALHAGCAYADASAHASAPESQAACAAALRKDGAGDDPERGSKEAPAAPLAAAAACAGDSAKGTLSGLAPAAAAAAAGAGAAPARRGASSDHSEATEVRAARPSAGAAHAGGGQSPSRCSRGAALCGGRPRSGGEGPTRRSARRAAMCAAAAAPAAPAADAVAGAVTGAHVAAGLAGERAGDAAGGGNGATLSAGRDPVPEQPAPGERLAEQGFVPARKRKSPQVLSGAARVAACLPAGWAMARVGQTLTLTLPPGSAAAAFDALPAAKRRRAAPASKRPRGAAASCEGGEQKRRRGRPPRGDSEPTAAAEPCGACAPQQGHARSASDLSPSPQPALAAGGVRGRGRRGGGAGRGRGPGRGRGSRGGPPALTGTKGAPAAGLGAARGGAGARGRRRGGGAGRPARRALARCAAHGAGRDAPGAGAQLQWAGAAGGPSLASDDDDDGAPPVRARSRAAQGEDLTFYDQRAPRASACFTVVVMQWVLRSCSHARLAGTLTALLVLATLRGVSARPSCTGPAEAPASCASCSSAQHLSPNTLTFSVWPAAQLSPDWMFCAGRRPGGARACGSTRRRRGGPCAAQRARAGACADTGRCA